MRAKDKASNDGGGLMRRIRFVGTGVLLVLLGTVAPTYAQQEQRRQDAGLRNRSSRLSLNSSSTASNNAARTATGPSNSRSNSNKHSSNKPASNSSRNRTSSKHSKQKQQRARTAAS